MWVSWALPSGALCACPSANTILPWLLMMCNSANWLLALYSLSSFSAPFSTGDQTQDSVHIRQALTTLLHYSYGFWNSHTVIIYIYGRVSMVFQLFPKCLLVLYILDFELFLKEWEKSMFTQTFWWQNPLDFHDPTFPVSYEISLLEDNGA